MKFSDAMRLGAMIRPQAFDYLFFGGGSCAVGAAFEACGKTYHAPTVGIVSDYEPHRFENHAVLKTFAGCPACGFHNELLIVVTHLNDVHRWTRESIADFVAMVEDRHESYVAPKPTKVSA